MELCNEWECVMKGSEGSSVIKGSEWSSNERE